MKHRILLLASIALALALGACSTSPYSRSEAPAATLAPMPETVTSFGAVTTDGWLYVFGGHMGERHDYSADKVSGSFHRLKLTEGRAWEKLSSAAPSQGLPLVAHRGVVYRTGGMAARNPAGTKQDLYSTAHFERFDPSRGAWQALTPLPAVRSSHDAVVMGDKLYIAGGWSLAGGTNKPVWPATALVIDLNNPTEGWTEFAQPFQRRALALAASGTRLYCIGGMNSDNQPTLAVDIYDTKTGQWSKGPELRPGKFKGFSCSAISQNGRIYANMFQGDLLRLAADGTAWEVVGRVQHPRLAHRIVTAGTTQIIVLGGEDSEEKRADLELLTPSTTPRAVVKATAMNAQ